MIAQEILAKYDMASKDLAYEFKDKFKDVLVNSDKYDTHSYQDDNLIVMITMIVQINLDNNGDENEIIRSLLIISNGKALIFDYLNGYYRVGRSKYPNDEFVKKYIAILSGYRSSATHLIELVDEKPIWVVTCNPTKSSKAIS